MGKCPKVIMSSHKFRSFTDNLFNVDSLIIISNKSFSDFSVMLSFYSHF